MSDLTDDERAEVEHELLLLRESLHALEAMPPITPDAGSRKAEVLERMRGEEQRMLRLLDA